MDARTRSAGSHAGRRLPDAGWDRPHVQRDGTMPRRDVPYVPTEEHVVLAMLKLAGVAAGDILYDLGCGDGRIAITAAREFGARAVGVDIDPQRVHEARENAWRWRVTDRVAFLNESLFDVDVSGASVVTLYLLPKVNLQLRPRLLWQLPPGARIVSNTFDMGEWVPDETILLKPFRPVHRWVVPAWVQGKWKGIINWPGRREHMELRAERHFQVVTGKARVRGRDIPLREGRLVGDRFTFRLDGPGTRTVRFSGHVDDKTLRGSCRMDDGPEAAWGLLRD